MPAGAGDRDRLIHDAADGAGASAALRAAAEATIDLTGGARRLRAADRRTDVAVTEHVAGADDHGRSASPAGIIGCF